MDASVGGPGGVLVLAALVAGSARVSGERGAWARTRWDVAELPGSGAAVRASGLWAMPVRPAWDGG
jgi:hypothetical protein